MAKKSKSNQLELSTGSKVRVRSWKKDGIIQEVLSNGQYRVSLGSLTVQCRAKDLEAPRETKKSKSAKPSASRSSQVVTVRSIDLHGMTVQEASEALIGAVNDAIMAGCTELHVVHGHGTGKVKAAAEKVLSSLDVVKSFKLSEVNSGVTRAFL